MRRKILAITGTRADYGLMTPVYEAIKKDKTLTLELIITGMHFLPQFKSSLQEVKKDHFAKLHFFKINQIEDSYKAMAQFLGKTIENFAQLVESVKPDIILLQGDRSEMLAGAIVGAFANIAVVHMSGGDDSGSIDDSIRNAISKFAHFHLTTCRQSTYKLIRLGESEKRILEVGEPAIDLISSMNFVAKEALAKEFQLDLAEPIIIACQHPVTTEAESARWQMRQTINALCELKLQTVFLYPNTDTGGREMTKLLESYRNRKLFRIYSNLPIKQYLSLLKIASVMVGNSSSGIIEAPSFKLPVVNIGTRQHRRIRANNIIDVQCDKEQIKKAVIYTLTNQPFRKRLKRCVNPYGDGNTSKKVIGLLRNLRLTQALFTKWIDNKESFY